MGQMCTRRAGSFILLIFASGSNGFPQSSFEPLVEPFAVQLGQL